MNEKKEKVLSLATIFLTAGLLISSLASIASAEDKNSGEQIGIYQGVIVRSNGPYTQTGQGEWQCVEYVDRFYAEAMGIPGAINWVGNGNQYYGSASEKGLAAYANGGSVPPYPGDILGFGGGSYGHVAIVTGTDDNYVYIIEQNWNRNYANEKLPWNRATNTIYNRGSYWIQGWLRKDAWHFNTPGNAEGWNAVNVQSTSVAPDGRYRIDPNQYDPYIYSAKLSLDANHYDSIEINMASNAADGNARIYFTTSSSPSLSESKVVEFKTNNDGNWQTYTIYMANHPDWQGTITGIRIDPAENGKASGIDDIGFDWIKVIKTDKKPKIINTELSLLAYQLFGINFGYWIENPFANDLTDVRLGAQIRNCCTNWADDPFNDRVVTLVHNSYTRYERWFKPFTNLDPGFYDAHWVILDHKTGIWYDDKEKSNAFVIEEPNPVIPDPTPTPTITPAPTSPPSSLPSTPTPTPSPVSETIELGWRIEGADGSAGESVVLREGILLGKESVTITWDAHGLCLLGSDASAIAFEQGEWRFISLSDYGENCKGGEQTETISLSDFKGLDSTVLDPNAPIGQSFIARIWHEGPFVVDIYRVTFNAIGSSPTPIPTPSPVSETINLGWRIEGADGSAGESVALREGILLGKESVTITWDAHGLCLLGSDASAIAFEQGEWRFISLSNYGENCYNGEQTVTIPLTEFKDINNELVLDPNAPIGPNFIGRIWHEGPFAVDVYRVRFNP